MNSEFPPRRTERPCDRRYVTAKNRPRTQSSRSTTRHCTLSSRSVHSRSERPLHHGLNGKPRQPPPERKQFLSKVVPLRIRHYARNLAVRPAAAAPFHGHLPSGPGADVCPCSVCGGPLRRHIHSPNSHAHSLAVALYPDAVAVDGADHDRGKLHPGLPTARKAAAGLCVQPTRRRAPGPRPRRRPPRWRSRPPQPRSSRTSRSSWRAWRGGPRCAGADCRCRAGRS